MASKKRKRACATGKQSGDSRAAKKNNKKLVQTPMTEHSPISAGAPSTGSVITEAVAQTQCRIFLLPAELRKMIYNYVFDTGIIDKKTLARVYKIGKRRQQRIQNLAIRKNNFKLENISHHHFALLKTCRTIYAECKPFFDSKVVYRFTSPLAVASFLCGGNLDLPRFSPPNLDVLDKAVKVQVVVDPAQGDSPNSHYPFNIVLRSMNELISTNEPRSLGLTFVDEDNADGAPSPACERAQSRLALAELMHFRMFRRIPEALRYIAEMQGENTV